MGRYDSSQHRVQPVFDALYAMSPSGDAWLASLLGLPHRPDHSQRATPQTPVGSIIRGGWTTNTAVPAGWSEGEASLPAPRSLLLHLVQSKPSPDPPDAWGDGEVGEKRRRLHAGDEATVKEAIELLTGVRGAPPGRRRWEVLEGPTRPDVYIETSDAIVVIEGKFTEAAPTTKTKWMRTRSQMLRHIDAAWDIRNGRSVFGFFIVESKDAPGWVRGCEETVAPTMLSGSLPHRNAEEQAAIANAFLGMTTWADVCKALAVDTSLLLSREQIDAQAGR